MANPAIYTVFLSYCSYNRELPGFLRPVPCRKDSEILWGDRPEHNVTTTKDIAPPVVVFPKDFTKSRGAKLKWQTWMAFPRGIVEQFNSHLFFFSIFGQGVWTKAGRCFLQPDAQNLNCTRLSLNCWRFFVYRIVPSVRNQQDIALSVARNRCADSVQNAWWYRLYLSSMANVFIPLKMYCTYYFL